jgi:hypothetical protein
VATAAGAYGGAAIEAGALHNSGMDWLTLIRRCYRLAGEEPDLSGIRFHYRNADQLCRAWGARALTIGPEIYLRSDCPAPRTAAGLWLLAHEIAHVVQQQRGPVAAVPAGHGLLVSPGFGAGEDEADAAADSVLAGKPFDFGPPGRFTPAASGGAVPVIQRYMAWEHVLLGNLDPQAIMQLQPEARGATSATQLLIEQCALLDELGRNPRDGDVDKLRASYPGVPIMRLPGSGLILTAGELNVLPDYLSGPEAIITAPVEFLLPLVQAVRAQTYRHFQRMLGRRRVSRREWSALRYPDVRVLPDIRESIEVDGLGKQCQLPAPERYLSVLARNACHFAPFSWYRWQSSHLRARQLIAEASEAATDPDRQRLRCTAQLFAGYADHFLQDSFAAGHLVNKTMVMQWYVEWLTNSGSRLRDRELLSAMTCERQPDLHGPDLYCPYSEGYEPASLDPQTAVEAPTLDERIDLSGIRGRTSQERNLAYQSYLAMLGSSVAQLSASVVHDYFNRRSLVVASTAEGPGYRIWGDRLLLNGGAGTLAATHAAQASRQAIADLLETGETDITVRQIFESMPTHVEVRGTLVPLPQWHELEVSELCRQDLFGRPGTRLRRLLLSIASPSLGVPSADYRQSWAVPRRQTRA